MDAAANERSTLVPAAAHTARTSACVRGRGESADGVRVCARAVEGCVFFF